MNWLSFPTKKQNISQIHSKFWVNFPTFCNTATMLLSSFWKSSFAVDFFALSKAPKENWRKNRGACQHSGDSETLWLTSTFFPLPGVGQHSHRVLPVFVFEHQHSWAPSSRASATDQCLPYGHACSPGFDAKHVKSNTKKRKAWSQGGGSQIGYAAAALGAAEVLGPARLALTVAAAPSASQVARQYEWFRRTEEGIAPWTQLRLGLNSHCFSMVRDGHTTKLRGWYIQYADSEIKGWMTPYKDFIS